MIFALLERFFDQLNDLRELSRSRTVCEVSRLELAARTPPNVSMLVLGPTDVCRHSVLPFLIKRYAHSSEFNIPDSSGTAGRSQVSADDRCIQRVVLQYFTRTVSPPFYAATAAFHRRDSLIGSWFGARCLHAGCFRVKAGPRRRLAHSLFSKQPSRLHGTQPTWRHTRARASSAVAHRTRDASSKRLEHPPLASVRMILTDGSRAPPSAWDVTMRRFSCAVTPNIQPHRSVTFFCSPRPRWCLGR